MMTSIHVTGDAYLMKQKNNAGQVVGLHPLIPQYVTPVGTNEELITGYEYEIKNKKVMFKIEDIIHIRNGIDPDDHKKGFAPLKTVLREIYGDESAGQLGTALLANILETKRLCQVTCQDPKVDPYWYHENSSNFQEKYDNPLKNAEILNIKRHVFLKMIENPVKKHKK